MPLLRLHFFVCLLLVLVPSIHRHYYELHTNELQFRNSHCRTQQQHSLHGPTAMGSGGDATTTVHGMILLAIRAQQGNMHPVKVQRTNETLRFIRLATTTRVH